MADIKRSPPSETLQWAKEKKRKAALLMQQASEHARNLFSTSDITPFLDLVSRLHHFDAMNLLLIYNRYPDASCLAGYKLWERMMRTPGAQILRKEWVGKGIDLLAPFTDSLDGKHLLVWYTVTMYDIGQTNVSYSPPASVYLSDGEHIYLLLNALQRILATFFGRTVVFIPPTEPMRAAGVPGLVIEGKASIIQVRSDIAESEQLRWLSEVLVRLFLYKTGASLDYESFLVKSITYCLFRSWRLPSLLPGQICPISELSEHTQMLLLTQIQKAVRSLDDVISHVYQEYRLEADEHSIDLEIDQEGK